ncbi:LysR family transcriptional regulator ArgP [Cellulomonas alba]|uniref:LysR family transcriptional regulator ArgP n=1 Tax=Cellulomonas alba TaxID=3053467 RepID=A0ABT7SDN6_9CELL|nr:LysR family transcriptional regulator ArgP [Cellulomonas alba]MDM7854303.1 LysR family transcriptional regulator ArgP [Cellulomonas alba]
MNSFPPDQLAALAAVVDEGTFERAAARLAVTPSAVSQRVRALEQAVGQVLVVRSRPVRATAAGTVLVRLAGQVGLLTQDAWAALDPTPPGFADVRHRIALAVNADSLATWFPAALADLPPAIVVDVRRADQDATAELLRSGAVIAAVTADAEPVQGCRSQPLGAMRYRAMAAPAFRERWFASGVAAASLVHAPVVAFAPDDLLQHRYAALVAGDEGERAVAAAAVHHVPSTAAFVALVAAGLGWGMVPEQDAQRRADAGELVDLDTERWLDVPLHWQRWSVRTPTLDEITRRVTAAARAVLRRPG